MKRTCKSAIRSYMTRRLTDARKQSHLTQARFSEKLMMDTRSYADLEHGKSLCCTLAFIIYRRCRTPYTCSVGFPMHYALL